MKIYLVGGAVRDELLDVPSKDRDWVVVGAVPDDMLQLGYTRLDADFPVFLHAETHEEYALARREIKSGEGYRGFDLEYGPDVTLEEDLKRRDLTINALAKDLETGEIIDYHRGQDDLDEGLLRHISPAFVEDPIRVLRIARFAAKFGHWGFRIAHGTFALLKKMVRSEELKTIPVERLWQETEKALTEKRPDLYFQALNRCAALPVLFPELSQYLETEVGHQAQSSQSSPLVNVKQMSMVSDDVAIRFASLFGSIEDAVGLCQRLKVGKKFQNLAVMVVKYRPSWNSLAGSPENLVDFYLRLNAYRNPDLFRKFVTVMQVLDERDKNFDVLGKFEKTAAVLARDFDLTGLKGAEIAKKVKIERIKKLEKEMKNLVSMSCQRIASGSDPLQAEMVEQFLSQVTGWSIGEEGQLCKIFTLANYDQTLAFVNQVADIAKSEDHHPDICFGYKQCIVRYITHAADGLTENDFICAAKINQIEA